jgi:hypothetical protein
VEDANRLKQLLDQFQIRNALQIANGKQPVLVAGNSHESYCHAALSIGAAIYYKILEGTFSGCMRIEWMYNSPFGDFTRIENADIRQHWTEICKAVMSLGLAEHTVQNLHVQLECEKARLRKNGNVRTGGMPGRPRNTDRDIKWAKAYKHGLGTKTWDSIREFANRAIGEPKLLDPNYSNVGPLKFTVDGIVKAVNKGLRQLENNTK